MNSFIASTKTRIPSPPRLLVRRSRLTTLLDQALESKIVLISAPAGFGKTSLAAEYFAFRTEKQSVKIPVAWVSIDASDDDPVRFWSCISTALERVSRDDWKCSPVLVQSGADPEPADPDNKAESFVSFQPPSVSDLAQALLVRIDERNKPVFLVLDDFHLVQSRAILESFSWFIERLPQDCRILLLSRRDPPLPLPRYRARGMLAELRARDLRFEADEAEAFFQVTGIPSLSREQSRIIDEKTEGWVAGLQMAALSLAGKRDPEVFVRNFSGSDRFILEFLVEEVLAAQNDDVRNFIFDSALLGKFNAELCDASFSPAAGAAEMLRRLESENLFLVPLDDEGNWYRYHHLFAETLDARRRGRDPQKDLCILEQAATWYLERNQREQAVRHLIKAGKQEQAAAILDSVSYTLLARGERVTLQTLIEGIGEKALLTRPELAETAGWASVFSGHKERAIAFISRFSASSERHADEGTRKDILGVAGAMRAFMQLQTGNLALATESAQEADSLLSGNHIFARTIIPFILGSVDRISCRYNEGLRHIHEFSRLSREWGELWNMMMASYELCLSYRLMGKLQEAAEVYSEAMGLARNSGIPGFASSCKVHGNYAEILYEWNELEKLDTLLAPYLDGGENWLLPTDILTTLAPAIKSAIARKDHHTAGVLIEKASVLESKAIIFPRIKTIHRDLRARAAIARGDAALAPQLPSGLNPDMRALVLAEEMTDIRVLMALGVHEEAAHRALCLAQECEDQGGLALGIEAGAAAAIGLSLSGNEAVAKITLEHWLEIAAAPGFIRTFMDFGEPMRELLARTVPLPGSSGEAALRILLAFEEETGPEGSSRPQSGGLEKPVPTENPYTLDSPSPREREVLKLLALGLSNREIGEQLFISEATVKTHLHRLSTKSGARNRLALVNLARHSGLIS